MVYKDIHTLSTKRNIIADYYAAVATGDAIKHFLISMPEQVDTFSLQATTASMGTTENVIWGVNEQYVPPEICLANSTNNDTLGGTGATRVRIIGTDINYNEVREFVDMNGQTGVTTVNQYYRINAMQVVGVGSLEVNDGDIYIGTGAITAGVPDTIINHGAAGSNKLTTGIYSVPVGKVLLLNDFIASSEDTSKYNFRVRFTDDFIKNEKIFEFFQRQATNEIHFQYPIWFKEGTDIKLTGTVSTGSKTASMYARGGVFSVPSN